MPISILISKIIFMKYLPPVRPKFVPQKCSIVIEIWHIRYLKYPSVGYDVENGFYEIFGNYSAKIGPKIKRD